MRAIGIGVVVTALVAGLVVLGVPAARAGHDAACNAMPTSGQRPGNVSCNPRQKCVNDIPGNVQGPARTAAVNTCNALPTSGQCPGTVSFNPRQECLAKLPQPPSLKVDDVDGTAYASGNEVRNIRSDQWLVVKGRNVGLPGNRVSAGQGDFTLKRGTRPGCSGDDCLALEVHANAKWADICDPAKGKRTFTITEATGHNSAAGEFRIVHNDLSPRPPKLPDPRTTDLVRRIILYPIEVVDSDRNYVVVKVPQPGQEMMIAIKPADSRIGADPSWFAITATSIREGASQGVKSRPLLGSKPGETVAVEFKLHVFWHGQPCDPKPEGAIDVKVTARLPNAEETASGQVWVRPRQ